MKLGERFTVVLKVKRPQGTQVFVPSSPDLSPFKLRGYIPPTDASGGPTEEHRYELVALRLGPRRVPRIEITYRLPNGTSGALQTERMKVFVASHMQNDQERVLSPPPSPVPVKATNWGLLWFLSVIGAAAAAALLTLIVLRLLRNRLVEGGLRKPVLPPNELALAKLNALDASGDTAASRYAETIDVLREYLGGRFRFDGLESTTAELKIHLGRSDLDTSSYELTLHIVEEADLIKFAKMTPGDDEAKTVIAQVRDVVLHTWIEPDPSDDQPEVKRLESATRSERLKAGFLDGLVFGLPCFAVFVGLWLQGLLMLGWVPIALFSLLMLGRDALGGGSLGKRLLGLRIASRDESQSLPSLRERLGRNIMLVLAPIGVPIEALVLTYNPVLERLGDLSLIHI